VRETRRQRWRRRSKAGVACYQVPLAREDIAALIALGRISERDANDRTRVAEAVARIIREVWREK
jgi:hypothetical protein